MALYFTDPVETGRRLRALRENRQPWRGEAILQDASGAAKPLLVRADPVLSSPERVIGFVLMFTDLTERKAAESARRRFQEGIVQSHRQLAGRIDSEAQLTFQKLMSTVVENAQLAALEITDGSDTSAMPALLESVRISVARAAEVLEHLSIEPNGEDAKPA